MLDTFQLMIPCAMGLEALVADELRALGYEDLRVENGRVRLEGGIEDIALCNLWMRIGDRVLIVLGEFEAFTFDELFDQTRELPWEELIPRDGIMHVNGRSHQSQLMSVRSSQSIVKKAVVDAMKRKYRHHELPEDGALYSIEVIIHKDRVMLTVDTTGPSLHKRGYRTDAGDAPLKETLAAAMVQLSRWDPSRSLADPCCGSGTIAIEAALRAENRAPGLKRTFSAEAWANSPTDLWKDLRADAQRRIEPGDFRILASDINYKVLQKAKVNAENAGVADRVAFQRLPLSEFRSRKKYGCLITNPPYGERLGEIQEAEALYRELGALFEELDTWSFFVLSASKDFERLARRQSSKRRKLFNGRLECHFYQFYGPRPPHKDESTLAESDEP